MQKTGGKMVLATFTACMLATTTPMLDVPCEDDTEYSPLDFPFDYKFIAKQELGLIYDAYLFFTPQNMYYTGWLCSKDRDGKIVGWQLIEFWLAKKIFPDLKNRKDQYAPICLSSES